MIREAIAAPLPISSRPVIQRWLSDSYFAKIAGFKNVVLVSRKLYGPPGKGKPLDLGAYFATPEHLRMAYSILKRSNS